MAAAAIIGTVGRLHVQKGQRRFLEAIHIVRQEIPDLIALVVGDGELERGLIGVKPLRETGDQRELTLPETAALLGADRQIS